MAQQKDLLEYLDFSHLECLNQKPTAPVANALKQGYRDQDELVLESDADEQILINVAFNQKVKLQAISIKGPAGSAPRLVHLFANRSSMGFSDVQGSTPSSQDLALTPEQVASGEPVALKQTKFGFVNTLSIFIETNQDDEETTKVSKIVLLGQSGEVFNVSQIKKVEDS